MPQTRPTLPPPELTHESYSCQPGTRLMGILGTEQPPIVLASSVQLVQNFAVSLIPQSGTAFLAYHPLYGQPMT
jgi:hypothetical protein